VCLASTEAFHVDLLTGDAADDFWAGYGYVPDATH